jgi:quinol monooxygenase YgiN
MSGEVIYVDRFEVAEGRVEDFKRYAAELATFVEENEPAVRSYHYYMDGDNGAGTAVFIFGNPEALDRHLDLVSTRFQEGYQLLRASDIELLGRPSERAAAMAASFGGRVRASIAGFDREGSLTGA